MKTGTKLRLKNGVLIGNNKTVVDNSILPIWEIGYSNQTDSEKYYDLIPLPQYSLKEEINSKQDLPFFLQHEKHKLLEIFEVL